MQVTVKLLNPETIKSAVEKIGRKAAISRGIKPWECEPEQAHKIGLAVISNRHWEPIRSIVTEFYVEASLACWVQLLRHGIGTNKVGESSRYNNIARNGCVLPEKFTKNEVLLRRYMAITTAILAEYETLVEVFGVSYEDASYILPRATIYSYNFDLSIQALANLANLRVCTKAQAEIRGVVTEMCRQVAEVEPEFGELFVARGKLFGKCYEEKPCGRCFEDEE